MAHSGMRYTCKSVALVDVVYITNAAVLEVRRIRECATLANPYITNATVLEVRRIPGTLIQPLPQGFRESHATGIRVGFVSLAQVHRIRMANVRHSPQNERRESLAKITKCPFHAVPSSQSHLPQLLYTMAIPQAYSSRKRCIPSKY